jgi:PEP-CTERM motif
MAFASTQLPMRRFTFVLLLLAATPVSADPILATIENRCVPFVPNAEVFWRSTAHFRFASFWSLEAGCAPTVEIPTTMYKRFDNFDGTGGLLIHVSSDMLYPCGRGQFDAGDTWYLTVDTGIDCADYIPPAPPPIVLPPIVPFAPPDLLTPVVEFIPTDTSNGTGTSESGTVITTGITTGNTASTLTTGVPPPVTTAPEPGTLGLVGVGLWGLARLRRSRRHAAGSTRTSAQQP